MQRNRFDQRKSLERGEAAEQRFGRLARDRGWSVTPATARENAAEHWDVLIERAEGHPRLPPGRPGDPAEQAFRVDVKARKHAARDYRALDDRWCWIELHGIGRDDRGWLYGGRADLIAFERPDSFLIVRRADLAELVTRLLALGLIAERFRDAARNTLYRRRSRPNEVTTQIQYAWLRAVLWEEWPDRPAAARRSAQAAG